MAESCRTTPSLTNTVVQTSTSTIPTTITTETTLEPTTSTLTVTSTSCTTNTTAVPPVTSCKTDITTETTTIPGGKSTIIITSEIQAPFTATVLETLFGTTCSDTSVTGPTTSSSSTSDTTLPTSSPTSSSTSPSLGPPTTTVTTTKSGEPTTQTDSSQNQSQGTNIGPIVGGAVGGVLGLALLGLLTWYFMKKNNRFDNIFDKDDNDHFHHGIGFEKNTGANANAQGYQYGLLDQEVNNAPNPGHFNPSAQAHSNAMQSGGNFQDTGFHSNINDTGYGVDGQHVRSPSLSPLLGGSGVVAGAVAGQAAATSRPSTGGSMQPLISQGQQGYPPPQQQHAYPPPQQPFNAYNPAANVQNQSFGGFNPYAASGTESYAQSSLSHTMSTGSGATAPWSGSTPSNYSVPVPTVVPVVGGSAAAAASSGRRTQSDQETRSGSPVSIQENRVLQVMNPESLSTYDPFAAESSNVGASSSTAYNLSSSSSSSPPPNSGPRVDGKGRPVKTAGEKAPLVHLDGGRFEEPLVRLEGTTAPPAYGQ